MSIAKISNGALVQVGDGTPISGLEGYTTIPEVMHITGPSTKFDLLDVTSHDSDGAFREYIPGLLDGDQISIDINWRPSNTVHKSLRLDSVNQTLRSVQIVFPDTGENTVQSNTYVQELTPKADIGTPMSAAVKFKVTGNPLWL